MKPYAKVCPSCGGELVEVDNPLRREVRHRHGQEVSCPAFGVVTERDSAPHRDGDRDAPKSADSGRTGDES